jgi:hypothetical protein
MGTSTGASRKVPVVVAFIVLSALALALAGAVAIPFIVIGAALWLVTFPLRLLFKLIGGILGMVFGLLGGLIDSLSDRS